MHVKLLALALVSYSLVGWVWTSSCGKIYSNKVTEGDTKVIVRKHNELRKLIANGKVPGQPRGINLKKLKYDAALAEAAQKIANSCEFAHKTVRDGRWYAVGQNLYIMYSTAPSSGANWSSAIQTWFNEYEDYKFGRCCESGSKMTGHYTQVVWANTEYVGCGFTYYETNEIFKYHKLYVCNYGPAGNFIGQLPYQVGSSGCENLC
ncbi:CRISP/Allergen/PR-1-like [Euwallacea fornicatus]|uniref:CRISP/Allergen/PR-1-like n=1 Tax=Euwallacea fornicatus TaxID=995702 RepID=UPI00338F6915